MGLRRLVNLFHGLPPGCAVHRAQDPDGAGADWGTLEELAAATLEMLDAMRRNFIEANSKKGARRQRPLKVPRPADARRRRERRQATPEDLARIMGRVGGARMRGDR